MRTLARLLSVLLSLVALGVVGWFAAQRFAPSADPDETPAETGLAGPAEPVVVDRKPVPIERTHASMDGLSGADLEWVELNKEAADLLEAGELAAAVERFERCYEAVPDSSIFRRNLAEALVRLARWEYDEQHALVPAIEHLARAIELAPERTDADVLRRILQRWKDELALAQNHTTDLSIYFELSYDVDREDIVADSQAVLNHLESAYGYLRDWFVADPIIADGRPKIRVVLYNREEFDRLTGLGDWAGGVFDGVVRVSVEDLASQELRWKRVLTHELVHAFVHEVGDDAPGWLNEGLAQWLEDLPLGAGGGGRAARARRKLAPLEELFPLERLQGSLASWKDTQAIGLAYAQSLALVDHIARTYGEEALRRMVHDAEGDIDAAEAFEHATGVPLSFALETLADELKR